MSFLSSLSSYFTLPSLPSLPSFPSLPQNIQRRFLSFLLKRSLGHLVKEGALDPERLEAQVGSGTVEIKGAELNEQAVNDLIPPSVPLRLESGSLGTLSAKIPWSTPFASSSTAAPSSFPSSSTTAQQPLTLSLTHLHLNFVLSPHSSAIPPPSRSDIFSDHVDLAESVASVADEFVRSELDEREERELVRSVHTLRRDEEMDPFNLSPDGTGEDDFEDWLPPGSIRPFLDNKRKSSTGEQQKGAKTLLAGVVEGLLSRLRVDVKDVRIRIRVEGVGKEGGMELELRVGSVGYRDEGKSINTTTTTAPQSSSSTYNGHSRSVKTLRILSIAVFTRLLPPLPTSRSSTPTRRASSSAAFSSSDEDEDDEVGSAAEMMMSQAVVDLRESTILGSEAGESVYESATGGSFFGSVSGTGMDRGGQSPREEESRPLSPTDQGDPAPMREKEEWKTLASFGSEEVVVKISSSPPSASPLASSTAPITSSPSMDRSTSTSSLTKPLSTQPTLSVDVSLPNLSVLLLPAQARSLYLVTSLLFPSTHSLPLSRNPHSHSPASPSPPLYASVHLKSLLFVLVYLEEPVPSSAEEQFWAKPRGGLLPGGKLELKVEKVEGTWSNVEPFGGPLDSGRRGSGTSQKPSFGQISSPNSPSLSLTVKDISILEHLPCSHPSSTTTDAPPAPTTAPIMVFDTNLPLQYDFSESASFPDFEHQDWRRPRRGGGGAEKGWRVRPGRSRVGGAGGVLKAAVGVDSGASEGVVRVRKEGKNGGLVIDFLPVHFFFDLSLVERLLPFLRSLTPSTSPSPFATYSSDVSDSQDITPPATPFVPAPAFNRNLSSVLDDLEAEENTPRPSFDDPHPPAISLRCPLVRAEIRCPAPASSRGIGDGSFIRSGIVILDVHDVRLASGVARSMGQSPTLAHQRVRMAAGAGGGPNAIKERDPPIFRAEWKKLGLFLARVADTRAKAFVVVGLVAAADTHDPYLDGPPLLPRIQLLPGIHHSLTSRRTQPVSNPPSSSSSPKTLDIRIPSVCANIHKSTIEGLQYFADDITQWLDGAFGDGSRPRPRDDLKLIGSRFFGSGPPTSSSKAGSSSDGGAGGWSDTGGEEEGAKGGGDVVLSLDVAEIDLRLHTPRTAPGSELATLRVIHISASDIEVFGETAVDVKKETILSISLSDAVFEDVSDAAAVARIFGKTVSRSLELAPKPILSLRFVSSSDLDGSTKETDVQLSVHNSTAFLTSDSTWVADLASFAKTPEGAFEDVVPSEVTRISLRLEDTSVHVAAPTQPGALVLSLGQLSLATELVSDATGKTVEVSGGNWRGFLIDDLKAPLPEKGQSHRPVNGPEFWKQRGYASLLEVSTIALVLSSDPEDDPKTTLEISQINIRFTPCADSIVTLGAVAGDLAKLVLLSPPSPSPTGSSQTPTISTPPEPTDLLASLEEDTFRRLPSFVSDADFIADDLPRNTDYLETHRQESGLPEALNAFESIDIKDPLPRRGIISDVEGETIRLLDPDGIQIIEDYWSTLVAEQEKETESSTSLTLLHVRISNCDVSLLLHDGFDWHHTRKSIEDTVKAVRRRLEKIRQLLASGQTPDESIEQASTTLFNSIYIGAPQFQADMDASGYLAALGDDDLLDFAGGDDTSQATSFQSVKGRGAFGGGRADGASPTPRSSSSRSRRPKLTRSRHARIEINLHGITVNMKSHPLGEELASSLQAKARDLEILDHIKTSTWKKFLTEMRSDSRGNVREADSNMVTIELKSVRPIAEVPTEEGRLRAKILPLRLHVDQDALDFLKRFFSFKDGRTVPSAIPAPPTSESKEIYLQHVEIFPIELKLDYKPKRVDYGALKEGKTIELMNFFHFDGAEMTLRRITLSGVTGWPRLFDTLNDLWTPDVKANQLAEIISGVSPIRSIVNVGSGVADLILLPIEQFKKDGRIVRGVQRGTTSFVKSTALEAIKLGARLATGTQVILEKAENVIGGKFGQTLETETVGDQQRLAGEGGETASSSSDDEADEVSRYANQPADVKEGISTAYKSLSRNINSAAETILAVPMEVYERSGTNGPVRAVVRAIPIAVLKPMIGASEAVSKTLFGLRNQLDPEARGEREDKYK